MINQAQLNRQIEVVGDWYNNGGGTVKAPTGAGKTKIAEIAIDEVINYNFGVKTAELKIVILSKSSTVISQLKREFSFEKYCKGFGKRITELEIEDDIKVLYKKIYNNSFTYLSKEEFLKSKLIIDGVYLLVIDEIHEFLRLSSTYHELPIKLIKNNIEAKFVLGLSGTLYQKEVAILKDYYPVVAEIPEKEAIANGWIAKTIVFNIAIDLTDGQKETYAEINAELNKYSNFFRFDRTFEYVNDIQITSLSHYGWACVQGYSETNDPKGFHIEKDERGTPIKKLHTHYTKEHYCWLVAFAHGFRVEYQESDVQEELDLYETYYPIYRQMLPSVALYATKFSELTEKRKQFLYTLPQKREVTKDIVINSEIAGKPTLCFTKHREDADKLAAYINSNVEFTPVKQLHKLYDKRGKYDSDFEMLWYYAMAIHTDIEQPVKMDAYGNVKKHSMTLINPEKRGAPLKVGRDKVIESLLLGLQYNYISVAVGTMIVSTGVNIPALEVIIFNSYDSSPTINDQASGRGKRINYQNELIKDLALNKTAYIINLYAKDTQEEEWLKNKQKFVTDKIYWIKAVEQITTNTTSIEDDFFINL